MPRKKKPPAAATHATETATESTAIAVAEPKTHTAPEGHSVPGSLSRPDWIDGPAVAPTDNVAATAPAAQTQSEAKSWGDPYKAIFVSKDKGFEMGEHRRFKQRVFIFTQKPEERVLAKLKDSGFTFRAGERAWTIQANPETRKLSDELAREFAGPAQAMTR